jgi:hypothetical protein
MDASEPPASHKDGAQPGVTGPAALPHEHVERLEALVERLARFEKSVRPYLRDVPREVGRGALPAWRRVTQGEPRWQVTLAVAAAIALQIIIPRKLDLLTPTWLLPALEGALGVGLLIANPRRINRQSALLRYASLTLIALITLGNVLSAERLVHDILRGEFVNNAPRLLTDGGSIWLTNVLVFALWYWEFDRGGPVSRALALRPYPDFQFVQMVSPDLAPPGWEPTFADYFYLAFTNAAAFSPTDVMPMTRWAKMLMLVQSAVSLVIVALVISRAINVLT